MKKIDKIMLIIMALVFFVLALAGLLLLSANKKPNDSESSSQAKKYDIPEQKNDYFMGTSSSTIVIDEFSDFACPICKQSYIPLREIGLKYKDKIKIIFHDFPIHDTSIDLAMAARCAGEQNLFWPMHDKLFAMQDQFATSSLPSFAVSIGADKQKFETCLNNNKYLADIKKDYQLGQSLEIAGTPTFFVNGYKTQGYLSTETWEKIIAVFSK